MARTFLIQLATALINPPTFVEYLGVGADDDVTELPLDVETAAPRLGSLDSVSFPPNSLKNS